VCPASVDVHVRTCVRACVRACGSVGVRGVAPIGRVGGVTGVGLDGGTGLRAWWHAGWVDFQQHAPLTSAGTFCPRLRVKQSGRVGLRGSTPQTCPMGWVAAAGARTPSTRPWRALAATASHKQGGRVRQARPQQPRVRESCLPACGIRVALSRSSLLVCAVGGACVYVTARSPERFGGKVVLVGTLCL
jgi:hypothetical protein